MFYFGKRGGIRIQAAINLNKMMINKEKKTINQLAFNNAVSLYLKT